MVLFCLVKTTFLARPFILIHFRINNLKALINSTIIDYTVTCGNGIWIMFVSRNIFDIIKELHKAGTTILLVEQNARKALQIADRAYVLETGKITLSGSGKELLESDSIKKAYLGG